MGDRGDGLPRTGHVAGRRILPGVKADARRNIPRPPPAREHRPGLGYDPAGVLIAFNKPFGVVCKFSPEPGRATLADYVRIPAVYPAGRLDTDSEGLLLLTDDGTLQARIADPRHKLAKLYWAQVEGLPTESALRALRDGVDLGDFTTLPADASPIDEPPGIWPRDPPIRYRARIPTTWLALTMREGKNRQVRRMTARVGFPTLRLIRAAIGQIRVEGMAPGEWREIDATMPWTALART